MFHRFATKNIIKTRYRVEIKRYYVKKLTSEFYGYNPSIGYNITEPVHNLDSELNSLYIDEYIKILRRHNDEILEFGKELEMKGHTCVIYLESFPVKIRWCNHEQCSLRK